MRGWRNYCWHSIVWNLEFDETVPPVFRAYTNKLRPVMGLFETQQLDEVSNRIPPTSHTRASRDLRASGSDVHLVWSSGAARHLSSAGVLCHPYGCCAICMARSIIDRFGPNSRTCSFSQGDLASTYLTTKSWNKAHEARPLALLPAWLSSCQQVGAPEVVVGEDRGVHAGDREARHRGVHLGESSSSSYHYD